GVVGVGLIHTRAAVVVGDLHLERGGARSDPGADRAQAVNAEALAGELWRAGRPLDDIPAPAAGAGVAVAAEDAADSGDDEAKCEFCNGRRTSVAGVRDDDRARASGRTIDALVACAVTGNEPQFWQRLHQRRVGANAAHRDKRTRLARRAWDSFRLGALQPMQGVV